MVSTFQFRSKIINYSANNFCWPRSFFSPIFPVLFPIEKNKNCQQFLLASQFFISAQTAFFSKISFQKKKLPTKAERANIGDSLAPPPLSTEQPSPDEGENLYFSDFVVWNSPPPLKIEYCSLILVF